MAALFWCCMLWFGPLWRCLLASRGSAPELAPAAWGLCCSDCHEDMPLPVSRMSIALLLGLLSSMAQARDYRYSDAHLHYVDFFQESVGMTELFEQMAAGNIEHVMLSGIPVALYQ